MTNRETVREIEARLSAEITALRDGPVAAMDVDGLVRRLCELAADADPERAALGQRLMFAELVEPLGDAFSADAADRYDDVFSRVIDFCRRLPGAAAFDRTLARFGLRGRLDLLERRAARAAAPPASPQAVQKAFILSRITLGADVAVTSLVVQKLQRVCPNAECVLLGPRGLEALTAGASRLRVVEQVYDRRGGLLGRLGSWVRLVEAIEAERGVLRPEECLVVDPDSRLTQLGLLPAAAEPMPTYFFESRRYRRDALSALGALTAAWLDDVLGPDGAAPIYPQVWLRLPDISAAETIIGRMRSHGARRIVAMNLGVGENPRKRLPGSFERQLVHRLLAAGYGLLLDKGIGEERARVGEIVATLAPMPPQVFVYEGGVGPFAALIGRSDLYVGYDSAFQHIAAAQGVPVVDMFVDAPTPTFAERWRPYSQAPVTVVRLDADSEATAAVERVLAALR